MASPAPSTGYAARAAVVSPYWTFWEASAGGPALRDDRLRLLDDATAALQSAAGPLEIVGSGLADSPEAGEALARQLSAEPDVIVVVITMAAPPTHGLGFLDSLPEVPVVVWALQRSRNIRAGFDASDITSAGTAVGTPQLTNMLARSGRPHEIVVSPLDDADGAARLGRAVRPAATAGSLRRARIARVGRPPPGYLCTDTDPEALRRATGISIVAVAPAELRRRWCATIDSGEATVARLRAEAEATTEVALPWDTAAARSLAGAAALEALDDELGLAAGAMNCHVPELRFGTEVGVTPCYGLGRETSRGIPWACAGDVLTAVAMLVARRLSGAALYHEVEVIDFDTGEVAIANSGEHDTGWLTARGPAPAPCPQPAPERASGEPLPAPEQATREPLPTPSPADSRHPPSPTAKPRLQPNPWYAADPLTGACLWFELPPGPASLVGFTPHASEPSGYRFVVAEGEITQRSLPHSPTVGGVFRFAGEAGVAEAWRAWAAAGVNHHSSCSPGHLAADLATVARYLRVGCVQVS